LDLDPIIALLQTALEGTYSELEKRLRVIVTSVSKDGKIAAGDALTIRRARSALDQLKGSELEDMVGKALRAKRGALERIAGAVLEEAKKLKIPDEFSDTSKSVIEALGEITDDQIRGVAGGAATETTQYVMQTVIGGGNTDGLLNQIASKLAIRKDQARSLSEAMVAGFERQLSVRQATEAGVKYFAYLGPEDGVTRPWCNHWVGRAGTIQMFEETADMWGRDKQPLPAMMYGGGYNCRHRYVALVTDKQIAEYEMGPSE
jgi:hypothetical protein